MKNKLSLLLALLMLFCVFAACDESVSEDTSTQVTATADTTNESATAPETTEPHTHAWTEWTTILAVDCTTDGLEERICACGEKETQNITALGHTEVIDEAIPATCTTEGKTEGKHCSVCNEIIIEQSNTEMLDHVETIIPGFRATCTESGIADGKKCSVCNTVTLEQTTIEPFGHTYGDWEIIKEATKTEDGSKQKFCTVCRIAGESKTIHATGSKGLIFGLNDDQTSYYVASGKQCTDSKIIIPLFYQGLPVTAIGYGAFSKSNSLQEITIPDQITSIGISAFSGCEFLTNVTLPKNLITIEAHTFSNCQKLQEINIPNSVQQIHGGAFNNCTALKSITFGTELKMIEWMAFNNCVNLNNITFSDCDAVIDTYAFADSPNIQKITFLGGLKEIRYRAFECSGYKAKNKKSLYICDLTAYCSIKIGVSPLEISSSGPGFSGAEGYIYVNGELITELIIPDGVTDIPDNAFSYCLNIKSVKIPNTVNTIGNSAFTFCKNLTNISLPNSLKTIGEAAFEHCYSLKNITIPEGVTHIESRAFNSCSNLENISLPNSLTSIGNDIGDNILYDCKKIKYNQYEGAEYLGNEKNPYLALVKSNTEIIHPQTKFILSYAFSNSNIKNIVLSDGLISIGSSAFQNCHQLESISLPNSIESIGVFAFARCKKLTDITIPNSVTFIGTSAFSECSNLKNVKLSNNITKISGTLFNNCISLQEIIIPEGVTSIGSYAFMNCTSLSNVTLPNSLQNVDRAFEGCTALKLNKYDNAYYIGTKGNPYMIFVNVTNGPITSCTLHPNTIILGGHHFFISKPEAKNIKSFSIPRNIISIPDCFFTGCSNLTDITFEGTMAEWENIPKAQGWNHAVQQITIHCTDGNLQA